MIGLEHKIKESIAHAMADSDEFNWVVNDLKSYILGNYIELDFLNDISMFLNNVAIASNLDAIMQITAENISKRIRDRLINSHFNGDKELADKTLEAMYG